jgi:TP901 family phage tail tape measure protein
MSDLRIRITGTLNKKSSITEINNAISKIEKQIQSLKLAIDLDEKTSKTLADFSKAMEHQKKITQDLTKVIREEKEITKEADGTIKEKIRQHLKSGEIIEKEITKIKKKNQAIEEEIKDTERLIDTYDKLGTIQKRVTRENAKGDITGGSETYKDGFTDKTYNTNKSGDVTSITTVENFKKQEQLVEKLKQSVMKLNNAGTITASSMQRVFNSIDGAQTESELKRVEQVLSRVQDSSKSRAQTKELEHQLQLYQKQAEINVRNLEGRLSKVDLEKYRGEIDGYLNGVNALKTSTPSLKREMDNLGMSFKELKSHVSGATNQTLTFGKQMEIAFSRTVIWGTAMTAVYGSINALQQMVDTLYLLDDRLVSIKKVMDDVNLSQVFDNATESAYRYGQTIDNALSSIEEIGKLGFGQSDAQALSENTMLLSTVGEFKNTADAANYLVAIMRQYKLEVADTAKIVDSLNEVSNKTGADTVSLAQGLSKASSSASIAGVTFDELNGMIASTVETLKIGGNEAGTFYKALFTRMQRSSTQKDIEALGIATKDMAGEMLPATEILRNIGKEFDKLDSNSQSSIAESLGGVWHSNKVISLLQNQEQVLKNTTTSIESYGSASKELENFSEGLTFKTNQMKASFQELSMTIGENGARGAIVAFLETVTFMVRGFNDLTEATNGWNIKLPLLVGGVYGLVKAITVLSTVAKGAKLSLGWIGAGIVGLELLGGAMSGVAKSNEESINTFTESAKTQQNNADKLDTLLNKYNELKPQINSNKDAQKEYKNVLDEIVRIAPQTVQVTDDYGNAIDVNKGKVESYIETLRTMSDEQLKNAEILVNNSLISSQNELDKLMQKQAENGKEIQEMFNFVEKYNKKYGVDSLTEAKSEYGKRTEELGLFGKEAQKASQEFMKYNDILTMHSSELDKYTKLQEKVNAQESEVDNLKNRQQQLKLLNTEYSELSEKVKESLDNKVNSSLYGDLDKSQLAALIQFGDQYKSNSENIEEHVSILNEAGISTERIDSILSSLNSTLIDSDQALDETGEGVRGLSDALKDAEGNFTALSAIAIDLVKTGQMEQAVVVAQADAYKTLADEVSPLNELLEKVAQGKQLSAAEAMGLIAQEKELAKAISVESGQVKINTEAVFELRNAKVSSYKDMISSMKTELQAHSEALKTKLKNFGVEIKGILSVAEANEALAKAAQKRSEQMNKINNSDAPGAMHASQVVSNQYEEVASGLNEIKDAYASLDTLSSLASTGLEEVGTSTEKLSDSTSKLNDKYENSIYVTDKFKQALEQLNLELEKQNSIQAKFPEHSKEYQSSLKKELDLLQDKKKLLEDQSKSLQSQIKSGKIIETGMIKQSSASSSSSSYSGQYGSIINKASSKYGVDAGLIAAIIRQESNFKANARSHAGAMGLMQLMPGTARELGVNNAYDPEQNIMGGTKYIAQQLAKFGGDIQKALYAYNAGAGNVSKILNSGASYWKEPKNYAEKVLGYYQNYTGGLATTFTNKSQEVADYYLENFRISDTYGSDRGSSKHKGLDLANGRQGDLVKALQGGKVITAAYSNSAGNWVVIQQDDGTVAKYMHMQNGLSVKKGQRVSAGDTLGKVGNTGQSTGAHLHLQIEDVNGKTLDPEAYMKNIYSVSSSSVAEQAQSVDQAKSEMIQLEQDALALQAEIQQLYMDIIDSHLAGIDRLKDSFSDDFAKIDLIQTRENETSQEWINQQLNKERYMRRQIELEGQSIKFIKEQIANNKALSAAQKSLLEDQLVDRYQELYSLKQQLLDERISMADQIVDTYKKSLESQKDAAVKVIDDMINEINKEADEADYKKQLDDAQKDRQDILDEMAKLSIDDSSSAKKRIEELAKELADQDESIADMQQDKAREDRIGNLNDQKTEVESQYDNLLNDEQKFAQMRSDIINANTAQIKKDLDKYYVAIKANTNTLGQAMSNNLIDLINQANRYMNGKDYKPIKVAQAAEGGILPKWSNNNGRLMYVHPEEMISSKYDTKNLLKALDLSTNLINKLNLPKLKLPQFNGSVAGSNSGNNFTVNLNVANLNGTRNDAQTLVSEFVKGVKLLGGNI